MAAARGALAKGLSQRPRRRGLVLACWSAGMSALIASPEGLADQHPSINLPGWTT
jgi:hypothetical protein